MTNLTENRLKYLRTKHKLTQDGLVEELNKDLKKGEKPLLKMTISNWENNKHSIKPDKAQQLADYFGVSVAYLLGYIDDKNDSPMSFESPEEFEKARAEFIEKLQKGDTKELALAYRGKELTEIIENSISRYDKEKDFLDNFFQLEETDKSIIRYLTENLARDKE